MSNRRCQIVGELVVPRGNGSMGREDASLANLVLISVEVPEKRQRQKYRVALVHVISRDPGFKALHGEVSADAQHRFLADPGMRVASVQELGDQTVFRGVAGEVRVEEIHRNTAGHADPVVLPNPDVHVAPFDRSNTFPS